MTSANDPQTLDPTGKAALVLAVLAGSTTVFDAAQRHRISVETLEEWRRQFVEAGAKAIGRRPSLSKEWRRLNELSRAARRSELDDFERHTLIPVIRGQLVAIRDMFERVRRIADDPRTRKELEFPLSKVAKISGANPQETAERYFTTIVRQCQSDFIAPIEELVKASDVIGDVPGLMSWAVRVRMACSTVARNQDLLFVDSQKAALSARAKNGEVIVSPPIELSMIAFPFDVIVREAARIAESIDQTITKWNESILSARDRMMTFWSTHENLQANRYLVRSQLLTLLLSLVLVGLGFVGGDLWSVAKQNRALTQQVAALSAERDACRADSTKSAPSTPKTGEPVHPIETPGSR